MDVWYKEGENFINDSIPSNSITCSSCHKRCVSFEIFSLHLRTNSIVCICKNEFKNECDYQRHVRVGEDFKEIKCCLCGYICLSLRSLKKHAIKHSDEQTKYTCRHCQKAFLSFQYLVKHEICIHFGQKGQSGTPHNNRSRMGSVEKHEKISDLQILDSVLDEINSGLDIGSKTLTKESKRSICKNRNFISQELSPSELYGNQLQQTQPCEDEQFQQRPILFKSSSSTRKPQFTSPSPRLHQLSEMQLYQDLNSQQYPIFGLRLYPAINSFQYPIPSPQRYLSISTLHHPNFYPEQHPAAYSAQHPDHRSQSYLNFNQRGCMGSDAEHYLSRESFVHQSFNSEQYVNPSSSEYSNLNFQHLAYQNSAEYFNPNIQQLANYRSTEYFNPNPQRSVDRSSAEYYNPSHQQYIDDSSAEYYNPSHQQYINDSLSEYYNPSHQQYINDSSAEYYNPSHQQYINDSSAEYYNPSHQQYINDSSSEYYNPSHQQYINDSSAEYYNPSSIK